MVLHFLQSTDGNLYHCNHIKMYMGCLGLIPSTAKIIIKIIVIIIIIIIIYMG